MARWNKIKEEDKRALVDLVKEEIEKHKRGKIERLSTNQELAEVIDLKSISNVSLLLRRLTKDERKYRINKIIMSMYANSTPEQLSERGKKGYINGLAKRTKEQRREDASKLTKEQRRENSKKGIVNSKLTAEQRSINGKKAYESSLGKLSHEEKIKHGKKYYDVSLGRLTAEQLSKNSKMGRAKLTSERKREIGINAGKKSMETLRHKRYSFDGNFYDSMSEAACGILMERYIPNFKVTEHETFQLNSKIPITIDFLVNGRFIEYHPILPFKGRNGLGDFKTLEDYVKFKEIKDSLPEEERRQYAEQMREELAQQYFLTRRQAIEQSPYKNSELVLVQSPEQLYDFVITRFGQNYPSKEEFLREFKEIKKQVKETNKAKEVLIS
ncbi:hypothetical protein HYX17_02430 [Candidatus Woesearchaeota archaeon]|nr:hypothetical protein [Candidatus Woesearchaeota archaeon]